jgi:hypothetical protein
MNEHQAFDCSMLGRLNPELEELTARLDAAGDPAEKARLAGELEQEVDTLLDCPNHQASRPECQNCRLIAGLRKQATRLVQAAGRLSSARNCAGPSQARSGR